MISDPPAIVEQDAAVSAVKADGIPFLEGSDPVLTRTYHWLFSNSKTMRDLVAELARAEPRARYVLAVGSAGRYQIRISENGDGYVVTLGVPVTMWTQFGDALEPWVAGVVFLMHAVATKGHWGLTARPEHYSFTRHDVDNSFAFQKRIRKEIVSLDPVRLMDLPDGEALYRAAFLRKVKKSSPNPKIPLPQ